MVTGLDIEDEEFYKALLLDASKDTQNSVLASDFSDASFITPQPGFVIKTKNEKDEKIFLNICTSDELPQPNDISEEELAQLLDDPDAMNYKLPLGLGNPHAEMDRSGRGLFIYTTIAKHWFGFEVASIHVNSIFICSSQFGVYLCSISMVKVVILLTVEHVSMKNDHRHKVPVCKLYYHSNSCTEPSILAKNTGTTLQNQHTLTPPRSMLQVFGEIFALPMTQPASSHCTRWNEATLMEGGDKEE